MLSFKEGKSSEASAIPVDAVVRVKDWQTKLSLIEQSLRIGENDLVQSSIGGEKIIAGDGRVGAQIYEVGGVVVPYGDKMLEMGVGVRIVLARVKRGGGLGQAFLCDLNRLAQGRLGRKWILDIIPAQTPQSRVS